MPGTDSSSLAAGDIHVHGGPKNRNRVPGAVPDWFCQVQRVHIRRRKRAAGGLDCVDKSGSGRQRIQPRLRHRAGNVNCHVTHGFLTHVRHVIALTILQPQSQVDGIRVRTR